MVRSPGGLGSIYLPILTSHVNARKKHCMVAHTVCKHYVKTGLCENESGQQVKAEKLRAWGNTIFRINIMMYSH